MRYRPIKWPIFPVEVVYDNLFRKLSAAYDKEYEIVLSWNKSRQAIYIISRLEAEVNNGGYNQSLLETGSGYRIFLNRIKEENWDKRMLKLYEKNIVNYLRTKTKFQRKNPIDILFSLEYGRVVATISDGQTQKKVFAIEILR